MTEKIKKIHPQVDLIFGTHALYKLPELLYNVIKEKKKIVSVENSDGRIAEDIPILRDSDNKAWVSVMYGCNNFCTYCMIPYARVRIRSRKPDSILDEVKQIVSQGIKEVVITGIHLASYGKDFEENIGLIDLLEEINKINGIVRIRLGSLEPKIITEEFMQRLIKLEKICHHFHL